MNVVMSINIMPACSVRWMICTVLCVYMYVCCTIPVCSSY